MLFVDVPRETTIISTINIMSSDKAHLKPTVFQNVEHDPVTSILPNGDIPYTDHEMSADERVIVALGYKQEFKREFSLWTTFCVSFAVLGLLPSFASTLFYGNYICPNQRNRLVLTFQQGMGYAGTAGMVWGWIIAMIFIQCVAMSMAELCSAMPTRYVSILFASWDTTFLLSDHHT